ncbi:fimbrial protein [Citrobacter braakii]|uniref:fimbrial protein n=1 Tax=Citrobacter braakii TaxID=57706 RepID=UPI003C2B5C8C
MSELIMKRKGIISLAFLMTPYFMPGNAVAADGIIADGSGYGLNFGGELIQTTCDVRFNSDVLFLSPIGVGEFSEQRLSSLSKNFSLIVENCILSPITASNIRINFDALASNGKAAPGIFTNQAVDGSGQRIDNGVGFAVFDQRDNQNVLDNTGQSRLLTYPITPQAPLATPRDYYVRYMQAGTAITAGQVTATLLVSAFYD